MNFSYLSLSNQGGLIEGVTLRKLMLRKDESGFLVETLRSDWTDVYTPDMPFAMQYMSQTPSGAIRDQEKWHVHKHQEDRFICVSGRIVTAIFDSRQNSRTRNKLNLFLMGPENVEEMYLLVIPRQTYHGFMVISQSPGYLLNFSTKLYNPQDEGRIKNTELDWQKVKANFNLK